MKTTLGTIRKIPLAVELLESRLLMDAAATMAAEHVYLQNLLTPDANTHIAVKSGNWSDASTWNKLIPTEDHATVLIPEGISVVFDAGTSPNLAWIRDEGKMTFDDTKDENLWVETITVNMNEDGTMGDFDIGTAGQAFQHRATITFADNGPVADPNGPNQLGRGLISEGCLCIYGQALTTFAPVSVNPRINDTTLQFSSPLLNWKVGDKILLTGTVAGAHEDEERTIERIDLDGSGNTIVTLDSKLDHDHLAPDGLHPYVADEERTITFTSENTTDSTRFGHIMQMHSDDARIYYAAITHMGRTDKSQLIDDVVNFDQDDGAIPGGGTNVRGRYALHFHRTGADPLATPIQVVGNFLADSPGWGYVNHSSNVAFTDNVSYDVLGAAFVTETGGEIGSFTHNLAVYEKGAPDLAFDQRERLADWGYSGQGFALASGSVDLVNNISAGAAAEAYKYVGILIRESGIGDAMVPADALNDPSIAGGATIIRADNVPIHSFYGNEAFASDTGISFYSFRPIVTDAGPNVIDHALVWGVNSYGINVDYSDNLTIQDAALLNDGTGYKTAIRTNDSATNLTIANADVEGWTFGLRPAALGTTRISGGFWHNETDLYPSNGEEAVRQVIVENVTFGTDAQEIWMDYRLFTDGFDLDNYFAYQGTASIDGQYVYALQQAADYIAFPDMASLPDGYPPELVGKTNQQLMELYGLAAGGVIAPTDAVKPPHMNDLVGNYVAPLPSIQLISSAAPDSAAPYLLNYTYIDLDGNTVTVAETDSMTLQAGWNIITRVIDGQNRSFLVQAT